MATAVANRAGGFDFVLEFRPQLPGLIEKYEKISKQTFDAHDLILQGPLQSTPAAAV